MRLLPGRARSLESAIGICLLAILLLIAIAVFLRQSDVDMSRFGIDSSVLGPSSQVSEVDKREKVSLASLVPQGFKTLSEMEVYIPENLYEKINGKAPLYIESYFMKLFTQRFMSEDDENLWMELFVYDMAATRNAFSVYSVQRRAQVQTLSFTNPRHHYRTDNGLYFVHGKYYVELVGSSESTKLSDAMADICRRMVGEIPVEDDSKALDADLALFGVENVVPGSYKLYLANAFGYEGLTDTYTCQYKLGDQIITAFFTKCSDLEQARAKADSYYNFLIENDAVAKTTANETVAGVAGKVLDFYGTTEIVFAVGPFAGGIHEAENRESAEKLAAVLINRLTDAAKAARRE